MYERKTHMYENRTGDLERETKAVIMSASRSYTRVDLVMGMPYASYVVANGFSNIDQAAEIASDAVEEVLIEHFFPEFG